MNCRFASWWRVVLVLMPGLSLALSGCKPSAGPAKDQVPPNPNRPAAYGSPKTLETPPAVRLRDPATATTNWQASPFFVLQTELSPATLVHSSTKYLGLFAGTTNAGLGAPTYLAWPTMNGPRTFKRGESISVTNMAQNWILVWWTGATGWTNWDCPWVVFLQHPPNTMHLDEDGLHLEFPREAGDVVLLPLYGYDKLPQEGHDFRAAHGLPASKVQNKTWEWPKVVTRDPLTRIRYWGSALREFPIYCEDTFQVNGAKDAVTIRSKFQWRSINDDWNTPHIKLAPLSPSLGLAVKQGGFPVEFSKSWFDLNLPTPFGPYLAIEGVGDFNATLSVLQYVNETEAFIRPKTSEHASVRRALSRLQTAVEHQDNGLDVIRAAKGTNGTGKIELDNFAIGERQGSLFRGFLDAGWMARALPYLDAEPRSNVIKRLRRNFAYDYLAPNRFEVRRFSQESGREYLQLRGIKADSTGSPITTIDGNADFLTALWLYAHFTDDWDLIKERWAVIKKFFVSPTETHWRGFGRTGAAELGGQAAQCAAFARMAYKLGDMDAYNYGCYLFARELVLLHVKQRGAEYFRQHQPWHSLEFMDEEVFLTKLSSAGAGWEIDGPKFPALVDDRLFKERWMRFNDLDVARFYRDYLKDDVHRELNWLQHRWEPKKKWFNEPDGLPSMLQLRSLLLNESPAELAPLATNAPLLTLASGSIANDLSVLRASGPIRFDRLIPPGIPGPFEVGLERDVAGPNSQLLVAVSAEKPGPNPVSSISAPDWPQLRWLEWKTPTGAAWTFGQIRPVKTGAPTEVESVPLNWNTRVLRFGLP